MKIDFWMDFSVKKWNPYDSPWDFSQWLKLMKMRKNDELGTTDENWRKSDNSIYFTQFDKRIRMKIWYLDEWFWICCLNVYNWTVSPLNVCSKRSLCTYCKPEVIYMSISGNNSVNIGHKKWWRRMICKIIYCRISMCYRVIL